MTTKIEHPPLDFHGAAAPALHANLGKREVKAPKLHVRDSGLLHALLLPGAHIGAELDLLLMKGSRRYGVEVKFQDPPQVTPSMPIALTDLRLHHLTVLYPRDQRHPLDRHITVVPLAHPAADPGVTTPPTRGRQP